MSNPFITYTTKAGKKLRGILLTDLLAKAGISVPADATARAFIGGSDTPQAGKIVVTFGVVPEAAPKQAPSAGPASEGVGLSALQAQVAALMAALNQPTAAPVAPAGRGKRRAA
jgi:hypothetical protein